MIRSARTKWAASAIPCRLFLLLCLCDCFFLPRLSAAEKVPQVWALNSWERALRSEPARPLKPAVLFAARGEWESFQVALRGEAPCRIVALEVGPLAGEGGDAIPPQNVRCYRAHQLHLTRPTHRNNAFKEDWYPDALIPLADPAAVRDTAAAGAPSAPRFVALPFDLPAGETHTFWIDVHVPRSARSEAYRGAARIRIQGGLSVEVPVELQVWDFELPELAAMKTELGSPAPRIRSWCEDQVKKGKLEKAPDAAALHASCARLATEHRLNSYPPPELMPARPGPDGSFELSAEQVRGWKDFLSRYHVNAIEVSPPHRYFKDPSKDKEPIARYLRSWDRALDAIGRGNLLCYTYLIDEPNDKEAYEFTRTWGRAVREVGSRVKVLVTEQTKTQDPSWGDLYGAIDIWVPLFSLFDAETAAARRSLGEEIWTYTALCQGEPTPWWHTDFPLLNYRISAWIAWLHHMKGLLYWGGMSYWNAVDDPWTQPETYGGEGTYEERMKKGAVFNGEGSLLYPGSAAGIEGPVPSMRLKAIRDGLDDFDYLTLLESLGQRAAAEALVQTVAGGWHEWSRDPELCFHARRRLGCVIHNFFKAKES
jgi:hypothetical protein